MKKSNSIYSFSAKDDNGTIVSDVNIGNEVKFNPRPMKKCICFQWDKKENCFDLIFYKRDEIKLFQLRENKYFDKNHIKNLSNEFSFDIINDPIHPEYLRGNLNKLKTTYSLPLMGAIKRTKDGHFLMIFAKRGDTNFEDNIIYVHGIWKVELSKEIDDTFFIPT
jgi:hypothetical protein